LSFNFTNDGQPGETLRDQIAMVEKSMKNFLFESFIKVINEYPNAVIVLRTFGLDTDDVIKCLENCKVEKYFIRAKFGYDDSNNAKVYEMNQTSGTYSEISFGLNTLNLVLLGTNGSNTAHAMIDDYDHWNDATPRRAKEYGKQIQDDHRMTQIFFDDNDCVFIRPNPKTGLVQNSHFVKVNTLFAMNDPNYFSFFIKHFFKNTF
jgi:hypothetical protein